MPTAAQFQQFAKDLRTNADLLEQDVCAAITTERDTLRLQSPTHRLIIDAAYTESMGQLKTLAGVARTVATEFDKRAAVCEEYAAWNRNYNRLWGMYHRKEIDVRPQYRSRPAPWVDV